MRADETVFALFPSKLQNSWEGWVKRASFYKSRMSCYKLRVFLHNYLVRSETTVYFRCFPFARPCRFALTISIYSSVHAIRKTGFLCYSKNLKTFSDDSLSKNLVHNLFCLSVCLSIQSKWTFLGDKLTTSIYSFFLKFL